MDVVEQGPMRMASCRGVPRIPAGTANELVNDSRSWWQLFEVVVVAAAAPVPSPQPSRSTALVS